MMPDPIHGVNPADALGIASAADAAPGQVAAQTGNSGAAAAVDSADIAWAEALLSTITQAAAAVPPVDQTRVAELQRAISSGTYQANPQQIAQRIIDIEALLAAGGKTK